MKEAQASTESGMKKGKSVEYYIISELLKNDFDVYIPVVDSEGIDLIVKNKQGTYIEIQVKSRTIKNRQEQFILKEFKPKKDFFICCHNIENNEFWIIPSKIFHEKGRIKRKSNQRFMPYNQIKRCEDFKNDKGIELLKKRLKRIQNQS